MTDPAKQSLGARVFARIEELSDCTEIPGQLTRQYLTAEHRRAIDLVQDWMSAAGMSTSVDAAGNLVGRYEGLQADLPALMIGSHLDTVRDAGKYDGALGVVAGITCIEALNESGERLEFPIEVVGFGDEEGLRFQSTLLGSTAIAGTFDLAMLDAVDSEGESLRDALTGFGLDPAHIHSAARRPEDIAAYIEMHIEQGPVLEAEELAVGVVTSIAGATRLRVSFTGEAGHAGTVPMAMRRDALGAAAETALYVEQRCSTETGLVGTVGQLEVRPGAVNVIPGGAQLSIDIRAATDTVRLAAVKDVIDNIETLAGRRGIETTISTTHAKACCECDAGLMQQMATAISSHDIPVYHLPSGAGHDAMAMADLTDVAMLFVRCRKGISHHPDESMTMNDADVSARVLLKFIRDFQLPEVSDVSQ